MADVLPGEQSEHCGDGLDNDCDGERDEFCSNVSGLWDFEMQGSDRSPIAAGTLEFVGADQGSMTARFDDGEVMEGSYTLPSYEYPDVFLVLEDLGCFFSGAFVGNRMRGFWVPTRDCSLSGSGTWEATGGTPSTVLPKDLPGDWDVDGWIYLPALRRVRRWFGTLTFAGSDSSGSVTIQSGSSDITGHYTVDGFDVILGMNNNTEYTASFASDALLGGHLAGTSEAGAGTAGVWAARRSQ